VIEVAVVGHGSVSTGHSFEVYLGKYRSTVKEDDFFRLVGRNDLASSYDNRSAARLGLAMGAVAIVVGTALYSVLASCDRSLSDPRFTDDCVKDHTKMYVGVIGGSVAVAMMFGGYMIDPHPVDAPEMRRLADEYNQGLRRSLAAPNAAGAASAIVRSLSLQPYGGPQGGGLSLSARF